MGTGKTAINEKQLNTLEGIFVLLFFSVLCEYSNLTSKVKSILCLGMPQWKGKWQNNARNLDSASEL